MGSSRFNRAARQGLDVANLELELLELLLHLGILLGHLLVFGFPLVPLRLEGLDFSLKVSGLDVGLAEPVGQQRGQPSLGAAGGQV